MFKRAPSARTKADSDIQQIALTSSPTIGNTLVGCSLSVSKLTIKPEEYEFKLVSENNDIKDFSFVGFEDDSTDSKTVVNLNVLENIYTLT